MRVLEITSELDGGGVDRLLYDYCKRLMPEFHFDFIVSSDYEGILERPLIDLGCRVYHVSQYREGIRKHKKQLEKILEDGNYDIIHDNSGYKAFINLWVAKKNNVGVRIAHAHQAFMVESIKGKLLRRITTFLTKKFATDLFACGVDAAKWMWGKSEYGKNNVYIMTNAIDARAFTFDSRTREEVKSELGLKGKMVIGNVARFSYQKNHEFLIRMFSRIVKRRPDAVLVLIGRGELFDDMEKLAKREGVQDKILFLGVQNDVPRLINALDIFVLPSHYEGLPVTLVEIQANGLPALISDNVTKEIKKSGNIYYCSLDFKEDKWAEMCCSIDLERTQNSIINTEYDINVATDLLKAKYISMLKA